MIFSKDLDYLKECCKYRSKIDINVLVRVLDEIDKLHNQNLLLSQEFEGIFCDLTDSIVGQTWKDTIHCTKYDYELIVKRIEKKSIEQITEEYLNKTVKKKKKNEASD